MDVICCDAFSSSSVVLCAFSALCVYSKFGHHPHPLNYLCAKFCFCCGLRCWASPWRKTTYSINHSITHPAYLMPWEHQTSIDRECWAFISRLSYLLHFCRHKTSSTTASALLDLLFYTSWKGTQRGRYWSWTSLSLYRHACIWPTPFSSIAAASESHLLTVLNCATPVGAGHLLGSLKSQYTVCCARHWSSNHSKRPNQPNLLPLHVTSSLCQPVLVLTLDMFLCYLWQLLPVFSLEWLLKARALHGTQKSIKLLFHTYPVPQYQPGHAEHWHSNNHQYAVVWTYEQAKFVEVILVCTLTPASADITKHIHKFPTFS